MRALSLLSLSENQLLRNSGLLRSTATFCSFPDRRSLVAMADPFLDCGQIGPSRRVLRGPFQRTCQGACRPWRVQPAFVVRDHSSSAYGPDARCGFLDENLPSGELLT